MKITLTTRTPVHIGTGEIYGSNEYTKSRGKDGLPYLSRIDPSRLAGVLKEAQRDDFIDRMDDTVIGRPFSLSKFFMDHSINPKEIRSYMALNRTGEQDPKEIRTCIKTAGVTYIPGSSLKGALRTALLWWHAKDDDRFEQSIREDLGDRRRSQRREIGNTYVASVFNTGTSDRGRPDPRYDLLRFLQVSDFMPKKSSMSVESIITYSLGRNGSFAPKQYSVCAECVNGTFSGSIGGLDQIRRVAGSPDYSILKRKISLLGMDRPDDISAVGPHLGKVLSAWNKWCLQKERELVESDSRGTYSEPFEEVETWLAEKPHIRIGFAVGTLYQTLIGLLEDNAPDLAVDIINMHKLGRYPRQAGRDDIEPPYPKSFELTKHNEPAGWVAVDIGGP